MIHKQRKESSRSIFAARIRSVRTERGFSQEHLADLAGLHRTYISSVERSERNISIDNMEKIARALGTSLAALLADGR